jgi:O-methyltransferase
MLMARPLRWLPVRWRERLHARVNRLRAPFLPEPYRVVLPHTMVSLPRLRNLDRLIRLLDEEGVPGDVVECGTCNGGSGAVLARVACRSPLGRHTWLLDSFAGMPPAGPEDGPDAAAYTGSCKGNLDRVREVLRTAGVDDPAVALVPGWFHETLPTLPANPVALLHVDADWYESVRICLDHLYDRVSPGGFVVLDDFGYWQGCRRAWQEFRQSRGLDVELTPVDGIGVWFRKPGGAPKANGPGALAPAEALP